MLIFQHSLCFMCMHACSEVQLACKQSVHSDPSKHLVEVRALGAPVEASFLFVVD